MNQIITLTGLLAATDTDVLNNTRLQTAPQGGIMTLECNADLNDATNRYLLSVSLPDGSTPFEAINVPGTNPALGGVIDAYQKLSADFPIAQGGHLVVNFTEVGAAILSFRITFTPT